MRILFIYSTPGYLGGIETLIVRMSKWLVKNGHSVTLLIESPGRWANLLPTEVNCVALGERFHELYYYYHASRLWKSLRLPIPDVVKSFDIGSSWIACQLATLAGSNCKVIAGIYNPYVFKWYYNTRDLSIWDARKFYTNNFLRNIPVNSRIFCGVDQIEELELLHQQNGELWPIPIDASEFAEATRKPKWGKIVSVGRLSPMKEYNLYMVEIVRMLRERGRNVSWVVYGTGEYATPMQELIRKYHLEKFIHLAGAVPYNRLWQVMEDAYIFIGMGTASLEASLFKVPNVTAAAYDRDGLTWGPVYRLPEGSLGQLSHVRPEIRVVDEIERILSLTPSGYTLEQEMVWNHVQVHAIDSSMMQFLNIVRNADHYFPNKTMYWTNYSFGLLRQVIASISNIQHIQHPQSLLYGFNGKKA